MIRDDASMTRVYKFVWLEHGSDIVPGTAYKVGLASTTWVTKSQVTGCWYAMFSIIRYLHTESGVNREFHVSRFKLSRSGHMYCCQDNNT